MGTKSSSPVSLLIWGLVFCTQLRILLSCNFICPKTYKCFGAIGVIYPVIGVFITGYFYALFWVLIGGKSRKIINLGILAHVDAGKTTLTEKVVLPVVQLQNQGALDKGTTRTDTMNLERQRGITIQTAVTSFQWEDVKIEHL